MDFKKYTVEDFLNDPEFIKWVMQPESDVFFFWENWLIKNPEKLEDVQKAKEIILALKNREYHWERERKKDVWNKIKYVNDVYDNTQKEKRSFCKNFDDSRILSNKASFFKSFGGKVIKWAAVILLLFLSYIFFVDKVNDNGPQFIAEKTILLKKSTSKGQKLKVFLPDGSTVYMNSNSSISYSKNFKSNKREIKLTGEAFFEVAKDSLKPFVVISDDLLITALGTSFNVKALADEQNISISLLTGKVAVQKKNTIESALLLNPNEAALLNREDGALQRKEFNYEEDILWTKGILYLKQIPITEAFLKLELWYGVTFEIENLPKKTLLVTGTFDNEYLENVLQSLSHTASFKYNIQNGKIMVSFKI